MSDHGSNERLAPLESGEFDAFTDDTDFRLRSDLPPVRLGARAQAGARLASPIEPPVRFAPSRPVGPPDDGCNRAKVVVVVAGARWPDTLARELSGGSDTLVLVQRPDEGSAELFSRLATRIERFERQVYELVWVVTEARDLQIVALETAARFSSLMTLEDVRFVVSRPTVRRALSASAALPADGWLETA